MAETFDSTKLKGKENDNLETEVNGSQVTISAKSSENIISDSGDGRKNVKRRHSLDRNKMKWRLYASIAIMCLSMMISFAATTAIETIQSSLNTEKGIGTASLAVKTASMVIQSLFLNSICLKKLGLKGAMIVGVGLEMLYTAANFYPRWWTLIPGALISGLGKPLERTAEATYLSKLSRFYVDNIIGKPGAASDVVKTRFFNFYYTVYMASRLVGHVASSLILGSGLSNFDLSRLKNANETSNSVEQFCGAHFCDQVTNSSELLTMSSSGRKVADVNKVYQLCGFATGCFVVSIILLLVFLVKLERFEEMVHRPVEQSTVSANEENDSDDLDPETRVVTKPWFLLLATVKQWRNLNQLLLLPLSFYNGMDNTFFSADFTKSFVTCPFGIQWVGFTAAWYGITSPLAVLLCSGLVKPSLRPIPFFVAFACHICSGISMLYLSQFTLVKSFILSAVWGLGSGLWPYTLSAYYGILFEDAPEAAYSNYWLFDSFGSTLNYAWSYYLCTDTKIYVLMILLGCSFLGYLIVEIRSRKKQKISEASTKSNQTSNENDISVTKL